MSNKLIIPIACVNWFGTFPVHVTIHRMNIGFTVRYVANLGNKVTMNLIPLHMVYVYTNDFQWLCLCKQSISHL